MSDLSDGPKPPSAVHHHNQRAWDAYARGQRRFARPVTDKDFGQRLSAIQNDPWLAENIKGARLLCLGSGGGMQGVLYAAAGADVTVVDISEEMLALDRQAVSERGLDVTVVQGSIDDLSALATSSFDIAIQPVSTCYVADVRAVFREVARVMQPDGLYVSQHKQPTSLQATVKPGSLGYRIIEPYYLSGPLPAVTGSPHREEGTLEFLHRWEDLVGGLCRAGFVVEDLIEPAHGRPDARHGSFAHRSNYIPPYVRIKARRLQNAQSAERQVWLPRGS